MKVFKKVFSLLFLAVITINATTYAYGSNKTEIRNIANFNAIKVSTGIDLYLKMDNSEAVKVVADDDVIDRIKTEVNDGVLNIYIKKTGWPNWGRNKSAKVYVTVEELVALDVSSGSDVLSENTLQGDELKVSVSSGSDVELDIVYRNFSIAASSGSDAKIRGKTKYLSVASSSGSDIDAGNLQAQICNATASSGSDIVLNVRDELTAKASSGADIDYRGNPANIDISESSGGDIRKR